MKWTMKSRGEWEAKGETYKYRAIQTQSNRWDLLVFRDGSVVHEATYPVTLSDCKYYAEQIETGKHEIDDLAKGH